MMGKGHGWGGGGGDWGGGWGSDYSNGGAAAAGAMMAMMMMKGAGKGGAWGWSDDGYGKWPKNGKKGGQIACMQAVDHLEPATDAEVEAFLAEHSVEEHAARRLRDLHPKQQTGVLKRGSMLDARDQTAVVVKRIADMQFVKAGDWVCPGCFDVQFSKNHVCRKCGAANPIGRPGHLEGALAAAEFIAPATTEEVEAFLAEHTVQEKASERLRALHPKLQGAVIKKGDLNDARDKTAVLLRRMMDVTLLKDGDWICPACYSHQYRKAKTCRKCQAPSPLAGQEEAPASITASAASKTDGLA